MLSPCLLLVLLHSVGLHALGWNYIIFLTMKHVFVLFICSFIYHPQVDQTRVAFTRSHELNPQKREAMSLALTLSSMDNTYPNHLEQQEVIRNQKKYAYGSARSLFLKVGVGQKLF